MKYNNYVIAYKINFRPDLERPAVWPETYEVNHVPFLFVNP